jgi:hypothetical protein
MAVNFLLKNVLLRNAGWVAKIVLPIIAKNYLSHEMEGANDIFSKITRFIKRKIKQHQPK